MSLEQDLLKAMQSSATVNKPRAISVPGWPQVYVKGLTVAEAEEQPEGKTDKRTISRGIARILCNEKGERILNPDNKEHVDMIAALPWASAQLVLSEVDKLNGLSKESAEALGKN